MILEVTKSRNFAYYAKRLIRRIKRRELGVTLLTKFKSIKREEFQPLLPVNETLVKYNKGIQQVYDANREAKKQYRGIPLQNGTKLVLLTSEIFTILDM